MWFSSKVVKQCNYYVITIYLITILKISKACYYINVTNQELIFFLFLTKITLTLILPTLHTI